MAMSRELCSPAHQPKPELTRPELNWRLSPACLLALAIPLGWGSCFETAHGQVAAPPPLPSKPALKPEASQAPSSSGSPEAGVTPSSKEQEVLERIRKLKAPRWRSFGPCRYDWSAWRLSEGDVRSTAVECGEPPVTGSVAVHCATLKLSRRSGAASWEEWRLPLSEDESKVVGGEDRMVATLCANARPSAVTPAPSPTKPPPATTGSGTPAKPKAKAP